jgi:hypothetical protein
MEPCHQSVESNLESGQQSALFRDFHGTTLANKSTRCNRWRFWKFHLGTRDGQLNSVSLVTWRFHLDRLHINILSKASTVLGFHATPRVTLNFNTLSPYSLPFPTYPSNSRHTQPCPSITILFIIPRGSYLFLLASYSVPNICGSVTCSLLTVDLTANVHIEVNTFIK